MLSNWLDPSSSSEFAFACSTIGYNQFSELAIPVSDYNPYFTGSIYILNVLCLFSACAACAVSSFCYTTRPTLGNILILLLKSPSWKKFHIWRSKTHYWRFQTLSLIVTKKNMISGVGWMENLQESSIFGSQTKMGWNPDLSEPSEPKKDEEPTPKACTPLSSGEAHWH